MSNRVTVTVPFFFTGSEGWMEAGNSIVVGSHALLADIQRKTHNHLYVCELTDEMSKPERSQAISNGMKEAHVEAKRHMVEQFGDDWKTRASYEFGELEFNEPES